jgi:hypothetical protein
MANPFSPAETTVGLGREPTYGTETAPGTDGWIPVRSPDWSANTKYHEDKGFRGSMVDTYRWVQGVKFGEYSFQGDVFPDRLGKLLRAILGNIDVVSGVTSSGAQTLSAGVSAGATAISVPTSIPSGTLVQVGGGFSTEVRTTTGVSGGGPYTVTLPALSFAHLSGAPVVTVTSTQFDHRFALLNNDNTHNNQPPSWSISDWYGPGWRRVVGAMCSELTFTSTADSLLAYSTKFTGATPIVPTAPSASYTTTAPIPGHVGAVLLNAVDGNVLGHELSLKRTVTPKFTQSGTAAPSAIIAGPLSVSGKVTVLMSSEAELNHYLNDIHPPMDVLFNVSADAQLQFTCDQVAFNQPPKINRGTDAVECELSFDAEANTTDAAAGGVSPILVRLRNLVSTQY